MGESLEIISYLISKHNLSLPLVAAPPWLSDWHKRFAPVKSALVRPRIIALTHLKDWADPRDVEYAKAKYHRLGFDYEEADRKTSESLEEMNDLLVELSELMKGGGNPSPSIMPYGFSGDDVCLLPDLRSLTCVAGVVFPEKVRRYLNYHLQSSKKMGIELYDDYAIE